MSTDGKPMGLLHLRVAEGGRVVAERRATNIVVRSGAAIMANLFSGKAAVPINQVQIGFATESGSVELKALTLPDPAVPLNELRSPVTRANFQIDTIKPDGIEVRISTLFKPSRDFANVTEAGLLAGEDLYNQALFEPVNLTKDQEITFFWQVTFPFGH